MSGYDWTPHSDQNVSFDTLEPLSVTWGSDEYIRMRSVPVAEYDGSYDVIPTDKAQTLPTSNRYLTRDVTVHEVPYFEASNDSGGLTVSILS